MTGPLVSALVVVLTVASCLVSYLILKAASDE